MVLTDTLIYQTEIFALFMSLKLNFKIFHVYYLSISLFNISIQSLNFKYLGLQALHR